MYRLKHCFIFSVILSLLFTGLSAASVSACYETELWHRSYDGGEDDVANGVAVDSRDNIIVTGYTSIATGNANCYTIKYDKNGNQLWSRIYDGGKDDQAYDVAVDSQDNVIITGYTTSTDPDLLTIKYDSNGNQLWIKTWDSGCTDWGWGVDIDSQDNVIVAAQRREMVYEYHTIKYSKDGDEEWNRSYSTGLCEIFDVAVDAQDNIFVTGQCGFPHGEITTIKYDSDGNQLWVVTYGLMPGDNEGKSVAVDLNGNIIVSGISGPQVGYSYLFGWCTLKYDQSGNEIWRNNYDTGYNNWAWGVAVDSRNNIVITGLSTKANGDEDYYTIKYNSGGTELCNVRYDGGGNDEASCVAIDSSDNIIVTGGSTNASGNWDFYTIKYAALPPSIISFTPAAGRSGATVVINGTNFLGANSVMFGNTPAAGFKVDSSTQITATVGTGSTGTVSVTTPNGTAASNTGFSFISAFSTTPHGSSMPGIATPTQVPVSLPNITVQSASLSAGSVSLGTPVTVNVNVANTGSVGGTAKLTLYVNGLEEASQGITVGSDTSKPIYFTVSRNEPGTYSVYVGSKQAGTFTVVQSTSPGLVLYLSMALVSLALLICLILILRRR